jgi:hypothetical protein
MRSDKARDFHDRADLVLKSAPEMRAASLADSPEQT